MNGKLFASVLDGFFCLALFAGLTSCQEVPRGDQVSQMDPQESLQPSGSPKPITLFLAGDVMTGRGIDQILPYPSDPLLHERYVKSARGYVELGESAHGGIQKPVDFAYIWGDALSELERVRPDVRIINLETSVTMSDDYIRGKGIHYRMHPENIPCLTAAKIDICSLANNHVLDYGPAGLAETLETLKEVDIQVGGAGQNLREAGKPAVMEIEGKGRVVLFSYGLPSSGIPFDWAASEDKPGVNLLANLSGQSVRQIAEKVAAVKGAGDIVLISIHWGGNWGYEIPAEQREFAHRLIDEAGVDLIYGHSSHHAKGIQVYKEKLILYGCGDFLNDYEGIQGYEGFRDDLTLMYFVSLDPATGKLIQLQMTPMQIKHFKLNRASQGDALWLRDVLNREGGKLGTRVEMNPDNTFTLRWD